MNLFYHLVLIIILYSKLIFAEVTNKEQNSLNQQMFKNCTLRNNQPGYCTHLQDCEYAKELKSKGEANNIPKCKPQAGSQPEKIEIYLRNIQNQKILSSFMQR